MSHEDLCTLTAIGEQRVAEGVSVNLLMASEEEGPHWNGSGPCLVNSGAQKVTLCDHLWRVPWLWRLLLSVVTSMYLVVCLSRLKLFIDSIAVLSLGMFRCCELFVLTTLLLGLVVLLSVGFGFGYPSSTVCMGNLARIQKQMLLMSPSLDLVISGAFSDS